MQRRRFIKVVGAGGAAFMLGSALQGCVNTPSRALAPWKGPEPTETDLRLRVLSYGLLAANAHNIQPWLVRLETPGQFSLYIDHDRLLPETDPFYRQIHISHGAFIENVCIAASRFGHRAEVLWFPAGQPGERALSSKPVARVNLVADSQVPADPLFAMLTERQSTKREYRDQAVSRERITLMERSMTEVGGAVDYRLGWVREKTARARMSHFIGEAMAIEVAGKERHLETWRMFRFNQAEIEQWRDGFGYASNGITGIRRQLIERLYSRERARPVDSSWARFPVQQHRDLAASAPLFGYLVTRGNSRLDQVMAGRLYERLNLQANALNLALHPHSQILQEYSDMQGLQQTFLQDLEIPSGHRVQMLYRLGYADPVEKTPRRPLEELLFSPGE